MEQQVLAILNSVEPTMWLFFIKIIITIGLALLLKTLIENIVAYIMFSINRKLNVGVRVTIDKEEGVITDYDMRFIYVKLKDGDELLIPIKRWIWYKWKIKDFYKDMYRDDSDEF